MIKRMFLGIDTATPYLSLALWSPQDGLLASSNELVERDHAGQILPELDSLLKQAGVKKTQLEGIGVGSGPGSYTGLRVGLATAKGLARAINIPLRAEPTLAAIAYGALERGQTGVSALDARRENVYAGVYKKTGTGLEVVSAPQKISLEDVKAQYPELELYLDHAPDASYLAQRATAGGNKVRALYL